VAEALSTWDTSMQRTWTVGAWLFWSVALVSTLVPSTASLTANRVFAPAALLASVCTILGGVRGVTAILAIGAGALVTVVALNGSVADVYVNGSSYGDERRFLLRTPAPLLLGPVELAVVLIVAGFLTGPMLLSASSWVAGFVGVALGWPLALVLTRAMHGLSRRWLVFVPAGLVVHDATALVDNLLVARQDVESVGWAPADTDATDLTAGGLGRIVQVSFRTPQAHLPRPRRLPGTSGPTLEPIDTTAVLIAPACGNAVLEEASARRLHVTP